MMPRGGSRPGRKLRVRPLAVRFWSYVDVRGDSDCWAWIGPKAAGGYGCIWHDGRLKKAHRVSYRLNIGQIPSGLCVCHSCDNRRCVNPAHLFAGTHAENNADRDAKGRTVLGRKHFGSEHVNAKLSEDDVAAIRSARDTQRAISARFGVSRSLVGLIRQGKRWPHMAVRT